MEGRTKVCSVPKSKVSLLTREKTLTRYLKPRDFLEHLPFPWRVNCHVIKGWSNGGSRGKTSDCFQHEIQPEIRATNNQLGKITFSIGNPLSENWKVRCFRESFCLETCCKPCLVPVRIFPSLHGQLIPKEIIEPRNYNHGQIGHFRVLLCLCFKASLSAKPILNEKKMTLICMKMKLHAELIFIWKVLHLN